MMVRHFLSLMDLSSKELHHLMDRAVELKAIRERGEQFQPLIGKTLGMIFDKSSTRTRVSFEAGMNRLGGNAIFLSPRDTQLGRGEPIEDTARVVSRMVDAIMIRTFKEETLHSFAENSRVPVINGLTDLYHPCQLLADMLTYIEHRGSIAGKTVTWIGDGNNMCHSYINAAIQFDFELHIACPEGYDPDPRILERGVKQTTIIRDPIKAAKDSDLIVTDVWASMGQEGEQAAREAAFVNYQVNKELMQQAKSDALFMHCLPAHRGEEVSAEVLDSEQSVVWDEAENRLHAQNALLEFLLTE
jgi:ornithine carbamoyltransferase